MLFLQGTRDEFADLQLLTAVVERLGSRATLKLFEDADHSFHVPARTGHKDSQVMLEMASVAQRCGLDCSDGHGTGNSRYHLNLRPKTYYARTPVRPLCWPPRSPPLPLRTSSIPRPNASYRCAGSNFRIVIPREDWLIIREQTRTDVKSVYYALASPKRDMSLWVFIDQTPVCQSSKACLELAMKNKAYEDAKDMTFTEQEGFNVVQFTLEPSEGRAETAASDCCHVRRRRVGRSPSLPDRQSRRTDPDSLLSMLQAPVRQVGLGILI